MASTLPSAMAIRVLLERLLGRDIDTVACPPPTSRTAVLGLYVCDRGRMVTVLTLDLPLAAYLGSSLALLPPGTAEAAIADGELGPDLLENVGEVLNVLAAVLNEHSDIHQRLYASLSRSGSAGRRGGAQQGTGQPAGPGDHRAGVRRRHAVLRAGRLRLLLGRPRGRSR